MIPAPRPHQTEALDGLQRVLSQHRRAQLQMACGSGKTFVGAWHAEAIKARVAVVLTPSLALVQQASLAWLQVHPEARLLIVCSDPTTAAGADERAGDDPYDGQVDVGEAPVVTTRADAIAHYLDGQDDRLSLVVGTYHSSPAIAAALRLADSSPSIDLIVCDEAHQLAGRVGENFATALRDAALPARQRIFMTATPVHLGNLADDDALDDLERLEDRQLLSMDDTTVFGEVAYRLPAGEAIARGLLADYRVLVVAGGTEGGNVEDDAVHALVDAVQRHGVRRILTFHNRVLSARRFAARLAALSDIDGAPVLAQHVDGSMTSRKIRSALDQLGDPTADQRVTVVASARVLREGVDVPAVDAVLFADPRTSNVDIIQAVGRALRLHPGKQRGSIVIPLPVWADEDDDDVLAASRYGHVWRVLRGLRAHDDRVADDLNLAARRWNASEWRPSDLPDWLDVVGVPDEDLNQVMTRIVRGTSHVWEQWYGLLEQETERLGSAARVTTATVVAGRKLGVWIGGQRWLHRRGVLRPDKAERLEQLHGWSWSSSAAADERLVLILQDLAAERGTVAEADTGPSIYEGRKDGVRRHLGRRLVQLRAQHRAGELDADYARAFDDLPGWTWDPLSAADRAGVTAVQSFVAWEKHVDISPVHIEGDFELGAWVLDVRRRKFLGTIAPALVDELEVAAPYGPKGASTWDWDHAGTQWLISYEALEQYIGRTGSAYPMPVGHRESIHGRSITLYQWIAVQRFQNNKGELAEPLVARLNQAPGWVWRGTGVTKEAGEPLDLGDPKWHGRATGANAKCPCQGCLDYTRAAGRRSIYRHRTLVDTGATTDAAAALTRLEQAVAERIAGDRRFERPPGANALGNAAGVPIGLIRDLQNGKQPAVTPEQVRRLQTTTADDVLALFDTIGSRGRLVMSCEQVIDAAPVNKLVADLVERGWNLRWIARELGYRQLAVKMQSDVVSRRVAQQVEELHARVGSRVAPTVGRHNARPPTLVEIEAADPQEQAS